MMRILSVKEFSEKLDIMHKKTVASRSSGNFTSVLVGDRVENRRILLDRGNVFEIQEILQRKNNDALTGVFV